MHIHKNKNSINNQKFNQEMESNENQAIKKQSAETRHT